MLQKLKLRIFLKVKMNKDITAQARERIKEEQIMFATQKDEKCSEKIKKCIVSIEDFLKILSISASRFYAKNCVLAMLLYTFL